MPKKEKPIIKSTKKESQEIKELKKKMTQEEINTLEQMIKHNDKVDLSEIRQLLNEKRTDISSPSLNKINAPQKNPIILERDIITGNIAINTPSKEEENEFKYLANGGRNEEPKYNSNYGELMGITSRKEIEKDPSRGGFQKREVRFESSMQERNAMQENFEKYSPIGRLDKERLEKQKNTTKNPFETKEVKYTPGKY